MTLLGVAFEPHLAGPFLFGKDFCVHIAMCRFLLYGESTEIHIA